MVVYDMIWIERELRKIQEKKEKTRHALVYLVLPQIGIRSGMTSNIGVFLG